MCLALLPAVRSCISSIGLLVLLIGVLTSPSSARSSPLTTDAPDGMIRTGQACAASVITSLQVGMIVPGATASPTVVLAEAFSITDVHYGPGVDFPKVGTIHKGHAYPVLRRHSRFPWLEIAFRGVSGGRGWVYHGAVAITGNLSSLPTTSEREFGYPTLTPTPLMVVTNVPPGTMTPLAGPDDVLDKLGQTIYSYLLTQKFEPGTERQGSVFIMDLGTRHAVSVNPGVTYSAASLTKLPVLVALYRKLSRLPSPDEARLIAKMMVCSDNGAADALLRSLGDGNVTLGTAYVNDTLARLGLVHTALAELFSARATPITQPTISAEVDQGGAAGQGTEADPYNQSTPADLGWLLAGIYQCALNGSGPLASALAGELTMSECRQIVNTMRAVRLGVMIEGGVPSGIPVAHKPGMILDTHGDAALVTTAGGNYVLVVILHAKKYLSSDRSFAVIAEISRLTYNAFNSSRKFDQIHLKLNRQCFPTAELIRALQSADPPAVP
jgi:beta-lactamase class A